jgi:hypothetical protein
MNKKTIGFASSIMKKHYLRDGYVKLNLLEDEDIRQLEIVYDSTDFINKKREPQKFSTAQDMSFEIAKTISNQITNIVYDSLNKYFNNFDLPIAAFLVKPPCQDAIQKIEWHQALTYLDESIYDGSMLWIALEDEEHENWMFEFIEGSHLFNDNIRTAPKYPLFVGKFLNSMAHKKTVVKLKKGQAVLFSNKLLNASPENRGNKASRAIQIPLKPKAAKWLYHTYSNRKVFQYEAGEEFFWDLWINNKVDETKLKHSFDYKFNKMNVLQFTIWNLTRIFKI